MGVNDGNGYHVDDVADAAAKLEYVDGFFHSEEYGSDGFGYFHGLEELVGNVAGIEVWEDEGVDATVDEFGEGVVVLEELHVEGKVGLHFAINDHTGEFVVKDLYGFSDFDGRRVVGGSEVGEREE